MDLLLYLVKRHEIDLNDIPVAELTEQYLEHLRVIEAIDVDRAGEFLVMAATLVEIKSQLLMPRVDAENSEDDENDPTDEAKVDPRFELVQQLLAYKRFKDASLVLDDRREQWDHRFPAVAKTGKAAEPEPDANAETAPTIELDLEDVSIMDLCTAFSRMLDSIGYTGDHKVTYDDTPISLHAEDIADRLDRDGGDDGLTLQELFVGRKSRSEMIGLFLATLELVRQHRVKVQQDPAGGTVRLQLRPEAEQQTVPDEPAKDWKNPETGEIEYDWPSEAEKRKAERRAKLRATYAEKREQGDAVDDDELDEENESDEDSE
jgi:segregation and condensation protein A